MKLNVLDFQDYRVMTVPDSCRPTHGPTPSKYPQYQKLLQNCSQSQMQRSDYVRACLAGSQVTEMEYKREITTLLLEMYSILNQMPEVEGRYDLTERMDEICRCLKS